MFWISILLGMFAWATGGSLYGLLGWKLFKDNTPNENLPWHMRTVRFWRFLGEYSKWDERLIDSEDDRPMIESCFSRIRKYPESEADQFKEYILMCAIGGPFIATVKLIGSLIAAPFLIAQRATIVVWSSWTAVVSKLAVNGSAGTLQAFLHQELAPKEEVLTKASGQARARYEMLTARLTEIRDMDCGSNICAEKHRDMLRTLLSRLQSEAQAEVNRLEKMRFQIRIQRQELEQLVKLVAIQEELTVEPEMQEQHHRTVQAAAAAMQSCRELARMATTAQNKAFVQADLSAEELASLKVAASDKDDELFNQELAMHLDSASTRASQEPSRKKLLN